MQRGTAPEWQRRGIGVALLEAIEAVFPQAARFDLFTGSRSEGNLRLYRRHGYAPVRTERVSDILTLVFLSKQAIARG